MNQIPVQAMQSAGLPTAATLAGSALPLVGRARVYACGITPYDVTHLGHAATFVWVDTLARVLHAGGAEVLVCRNVTDVDDVLLSAANRAGAPSDRFAAIQQFYFDRDMAALVGGTAGEQARRQRDHLADVGVRAGLQGRHRDPERGHVAVNVKLLDRGKPVVGGAGPVRGRQ